MRIPPIHRRGMLPGALAVFFIAAAAVEAQQPPGTDPLRGFNERLASYVALKEDAVRSVPPRSAARTFAEFLQTTDRLRSVLAEARVDARPGNLFGDGASLLRERIASALESHHLDIRDLRANQMRDRIAGAPPVRINQRFPWQRGTSMPACLLEALPQLPWDLQYRIDDRDLVLVDVDVNLVLDILERALPERRR